MKITIDFNPKKATKPKTSLKHKIANKLNKLADKLETPKTPKPKPQATKKTVTKRRTS